VAEPGDLGLPQAGSWACSRGPGLLQLADGHGASPGAHTTADPCAQRAVPASGSVCRSTTQEAKVKAKGCCLPLYHPRTEAGEADTELARAAASKATALHWTFVHSSILQSQALAVWPWASLLSSLDFFFQYWDLNSGPSP
jgi:hypothetical protein